jgi:hypothetical protein
VRNIPTATRRGRVAPARDFGSRRRTTRTSRAGRGNPRRHVRRSARRGRAAPRLPLWKIFIAVGLLAAIGAAAFLLGALKNSVETIDVARHFVYTAPTANDAAITLPEAVKADLRGIGLRHERIAWSRVDSTSAIDTTVLDMTPRSGDSGNGPVLKVQDRSIQAIDAKINGLEASLNASRASTGDRALFSGLTKVDFGGAPITIISSGLDLASPLDFRTLNWSVRPQEIVAYVKKAGEQPNLHGAAVTFVAVPAAGAQEQLREMQKTYRNDVWTALLTSSNAASVTFVDATGTIAASPTPAPPVALPALPGTPVQPMKDPVDPKKIVCSLPSSTYFRENEPVLLDKAKTIQDLQPCISAALAADATFELDGWTSYEGPLAANGRPAVDSPDNRRLSIARVQAIADLLVSDMNVPRNKVTHVTGHGNVDQPNPDPRSPANRLVVVSYLTK